MGWSALYGTGTRVAALPRLNDLTRHLARQVETVL
jgi:hypothetical protein